MTMDQLTAFLAVVRLGGIGRAAEALHLTQPAVTARIKALEESLCTQLLTRGPGGVQVTRKGARLVGYAEKFEDLTNTLRREMLGNEDVDGVLRIGVSETIAQCWLPTFVADLHHAYPRVEIEILVDISTHLRGDLLDRALDLAILLGPVSDSSVVNVDLPSFDLAWYVAADADFGPAPDEARLFGMPVITYNRTTRPYRELKALLLERVGPNVSLFPSSSLSAGFRLVEAGLGIAALPRALGAPQVAAGRIREIALDWVPPPLVFTATYLREPRNFVLEDAAKLARATALAFEP